MSMIAIPQEGETRIEVLHLGVLRVGHGGTPIGYSSSGRLAHDLGSS